MFKFDIDLSELKDVTKDVESKVKRAFDYANKKGNQFAQERAISKLKAKKPLEFWREGYSFHQLDDSTYVFAISGDMANIFDQGTTSDLPKKLLSSEKVKTSKSGKKYIDVPFKSGADSSGNVKIGRTEKVNISQFKSADDFINSFKKPKIKAKAQGIIRSRQEATKGQKQKQNVYQTEDLKDQFLVIKRVNFATQWRDMMDPPNVFAAKGRSLGEYIFKEFDKALREIV